MDIKKLILGNWYISFYCGNRYYFRPTKIESKQIYGNYIKRTLYRDLILHVDEVIDPVLLKTAQPISYPKIQRILSHLSLSTREKLLKHMNSMHELWLV